MLRDNSECFSIADTNPIKPVDKRARKVHGDCTNNTQALDEEYHPGTPAGSGPIGTIILRHGPAATHPDAHGDADFVAGAFGELSAECSELRNLAARVQAASYVACP